MNYAGTFLHGYEARRYTEHDRMGVQTITVPPDAVPFADVSFYQYPMRWADYPHDKVMLRLGQGSWRDTAFESFYDQARAAGLRIGGYWFADGRTSPATQAAMIKAIMQDKYLDMELFIDWERIFSGAYEGIGNVVATMQAVESVRCREVGMYTGYYYFIENTTDITPAQSAYLAEHPLWLAWYAHPSVVKVPAPWSTWTHWQKDTEVVYWGQPTQEIDSNVFNGTPAQFAVRYGIGEPEAPVTYRFSMTSTNRMSFRPDHNVNNTRIEVIEPSTIMQGDEEWTAPADGVNVVQGDHWIRIRDIAGRSVDGWVAHIHMGKELCSLTDNGTPPPTGKAQIEIVYDPSAVEITLTPQP